ncbi:hypothetical protein D3C75_1058800 [compost metagenome]
MNELTLAKIIALVALSIMAHDGGVEIDPKFSAEIAELRHALNEVTATIKSEEEAQVTNAWIGALLADIKANLTAQEAA